VNKSPSSLPDDVVPLSSYDKRKDKRKETSSLEYRTLRSAMKSGKVRGITFSGKFFVSRSEADAFLQSVQTKACPSGRDSNITAALLQMEARLDELSEAVRRISSDLGIDIGQ